MAKAPTSFLLLVCFSFGVFSLELETTLPPSSFLSTHAHPPHHHHHHRHNHHSNVHAKPPTHYSHTTTHAPPKPLIYPFRIPEPIVPPMYAAFGGQVFKKSCKHAGENNLIGATRLPGAVVKVECSISSTTAYHTGTTDGSGVLYIESQCIRPEPVKLGKCKALLVSAPNGLRPSNYKGGIEGATFRPKMRIKGGQFFLFTTGPLAFEPKCPE
ncbi:unnamed protein product [Lupinus luteus]|uniref:Uncharacterized protein n=1 Tax=Lupinus luteus TaxID=3873 RepID=A0AAV1WQN9_LUPLU